MNTSQVIGTYFLRPTLRNYFCKFRNVDCHYMTNNKIHNALTKKIMDHLHSTYKQDVKAVKNIFSFMGHHRRRINLIVFLGDGSSCVLIKRRLFWNI